MKNMTQTNRSYHQDDWLADFADQVLDGRINDLSDVNADPEMRLLAETVLQLKNAFPEQAIDAVSVKRVQARIMAHARDEQQQRKRWNKFSGSEWFTQRRPRLAMAAMLAVLVLAVVAGPFLVTGGGTMTGSAGASEIFGWAAWIILGVSIAGFLWMKRRK